MEKELVLKTMREAGKPISAGEVATLSGLDRKVVDKVFAELKKTGEIVSPVRCKWTLPAPFGLQLLLCRHQCRERR